jgi:GT2 family glycosyltransferase
MLTILVKALNEDRRIASCLNAVMAAVQGLDAEVILVDSLSSDRTVEIARDYPIRIVQFENVEDCGCGAAVQLGWQHARGQFVYVLDADMQLDASFIGLALDTLASDPGLAGVGGRLVDVAIRTEDDRRRVRAASALQVPCEVEELGGGGLYRRAAVEPLGYLADRRLKAWEEAELGARLRTAGWRLVRLPERAVRHEGHDESDATMLLRLWRNGRARAPGVYLRSALGRPWWWRTLWRLKHVLYAPVLHGGGLLLAVFGGAYLLVVPILGWIFILTIRRRSLAAAVWSLVAAHVLFLGTLLGFFARSGNPRQAIPSRILKDY